MHIVLYKPDIPQNTAAIIRLSACLKLKVHIIEPCGFNLNDQRFKRVVMDYMGYTKIFKYDDFKIFLRSNSATCISRSEICIVIAAFPKQNVYTN